MSDSGETNIQSDAKIFISYASQDEAIAEEIEKQLRALYRNRAKFFLDRKSLAPGDEWEKIILDNLESSDILVVVYRGVHSEYVGFEVGTFLNNKSRENQSNSSITPHGTRRGTFRATDEVKPISAGSIIVFHNVEVIPPLFQHLQVIRIPDNEGLAYDGPNHELLWARTRLGQSLFSISAYKSLYPSPHAREHEAVENFNKEHGTVAREITRAFKEAGADDVIYRHPIQDEIEVTILNTPEQLLSEVGSGPQARLPDETKVYAVTRAWSLFKLNPSPDRKLTWGWLRASLLETENGRRRIPWMDKVEKDILNVMKDRIIDGDSVTFVSNQQVYRPIVSRQEVLRSGVRRIFVQFVETLPRAFPGTPQTSRLLASIMMASRYHFTYIEDWEAYSERFAGKVDEVDFAVACRTLLGDLDRIEHEGLELGLGNAKALAAAFGDENTSAIQAIFATYFDARNLLTDTVEAYLASDAAITRQHVCDGIVEFFRKTCKNNFRFLELALSVYMAEIRESSKKRTLFSIPDFRISDSITNAREQVDEDDS